MPSCSTSCSVSSTADTAQRQDPSPEDLTGQPNLGRQSGPGRVSFWGTLAGGNIFANLGGRGQNNPRGVAIPRYRSFHVQVYWNRQLQEALYLKEIPRITACMTAAKRCRPPSARSPGGTASSC